MGYIAGKLRESLSGSLSLWEVAHRWEGEDPFQSTIQSPAVADRMRWIVSHPLQEPDDWGITKFYGPLGQRNLDQLTDLLFDLEQNKFDIKQLSAIRVHSNYLAIVCREHDEALPSFWFEIAQSNSEKSAKKRQNASPKPEVIALAQKLYNENPLFNRPAHIIEHPEMKALLAGISATSKTKRGWISQAREGQSPKGQLKKPRS